MPVLGAGRDQGTLAFGKLCLIEIELAGLLAFALIFEHPVEDARVGVVEFLVVARGREKVVVVDFGIVAAHCLVTVYTTADGDLAEHFDLPELTEGTAQGKVGLWIVNITQVVPSGVAGRIGATKVTQRASLDNGRETAIFNLLTVKEEEHGG